MRLGEILRLVWLNLSQNKSKAILTSVGIIVGTTTIELVIAIGIGGREEVAEQFSNLNAGSIDIEYDSSSEQDQGMFGGFGGFGGGSGSGGGGMMPGSGGGSMGGGMMPGSGGGADSQKSQIDPETMAGTILDDVLSFVPGLSDGTIAFTTTSDVEGGELDDSTSYTIAGVQSNYADMSNLTLAIGDFITDTDNTNKTKSCVLGYSAAKEIFGSAYDAYGETIYIDDRAYTVDGVLSEVGTVASGISPDDAVFVPYNTAIKYLTGSDFDPTVTVIAEDTDQVDTIKSEIEDVLAEDYPNYTFTITDAGSKMEAANASNRTLTMLLIAMAAIVFLVGGIGIMNVLFVSVRERANEIGILKAIGCSRGDILREFLFEATAISLLGSVIGVFAGLAITPILQRFSMTVELTVWGGALALVFGVAAGSLFGFYPAYKASRMIPVEALNQE